MSPKSPDAPCPASAAPIELSAIDPQIARAHTLPAAAYTDGDLFTREQKRIFARHFQPVAARSQLRQPGDQLACQVAGYPLIVLVDQQGELRAYHDVCRHRAGPLSDGSGAVCQRKTLQCRYHGWTYALDGRLLHTPGLRSPDEPAGADRPADGFRRDDFSLIPIEVATFGPLIFVRLQRPPGAAPTLLDHLGELPSEIAHFDTVAMQLRERREYRVGCNWKVYIDNYLEGYHIPMIHPALMRELDYPAYRVDPRGQHSRQHAPIRPLSDSPVAGKGAREREYSPSEGDGAAAYYWVFPNLMLNYYPDHLQVNIVRPLSVNTTAVLFEWYFPPASSDADQAKQARRIAFADTVQAEDAAICQAVQERLQAGIYDRGRFVPGFEDGVHHFQSLVERALR